MPKIRELGRKGTGTEKQRTKLATTTSSSLLLLVLVFKHSTFGSKGYQVNIMDHAEDGDDNDDVFIYMGGDQEVPEDVTHVRVHKSVKIITEGAFYDCRNLVSVEMHDGVEIIEEQAFEDCISLKSIKLTGVRVIGAGAFHYCRALEDVDFGDKLETIGIWAFFCCEPLRNVKLPKVRVIGECAFGGCKQLTEVKLSEDLETIEGYAFGHCPRLRRIAVPLKDNLLDINAFYQCNDLKTVNLVGWVHNTISSLLLDGWRNEMKDEIDRINQVLPNTPANDKTEAIQQCMRSVLQRYEHLTSEHYALLKNNMTQLELALWKSNLPNNVDAAARLEARVTCGANIIIPHVLSFLNDDDVFPLQSRFGT
jgi:hypothetical protein